MPKVIFNSRNSAFYTQVKRSVEQHFISNAIAKTGNWHLYTKAIVLAASAVVIYLFLILGNYSWPAGVLLASLMGFVLASIGFNVMHDACHGSYSSKKWLNNTLGLTLNALGGNAFIWKFKHNILHHTYTNVDGLDDDIAKSPLIRQCASQRWVPAHRFQHIYVVLVYAISSFAWVFIMDFNKYFRGKVHNSELQHMSRNEHVVFWASKILYLLFYIVIPVYFVGWQAWAIGFACMHVIMGLTLALVFQLAHVVEHAEFAKVEGEDMMIENEWAIHQVKTTANFAPRNKFISWFVGGLNFQVEHHLFPRISHVHYPAISGIVKETCRSFNVPYKEFDTMSEAVVSHFTMMRRLGRKDQHVA
jgi:linoleoyl-CoA desaturase